VEVRGCQISKAKQSQALNAGDNHKTPGKGHEHNLLAAISVQKCIFPRSLGAPSHFHPPPPTLSTTPAPVSRATHQRFSLTTDSWHRTGESREGGESEKWRRGPM